jgi:hypothetical protein
LEGVASLADASKAKQQIKETIENAFTNTSYPGDGNLTVHKRGFDCDDCDELAADFKGRVWSEVPLVVVQWHYEEISLFSPEAYRYYLPAYMLASLDPADSEPARSIPNSVLYSLSKPKTSSKSDLTTWFYRRVCGFTAEQQSAIKAFLVYLLDNHDGYVRDIDITLALETLDKVWEDCKSVLLEGSDKLKKKSANGKRRR